MNEVNAKFYILLNLDNMKFVRTFNNGIPGYTELALEAVRYESQEYAEKVKSFCKENNKLVVKEVQVIVCNMP